MLPENLLLPKHNLTYNKTSSDFHNTIENDFTSNGKI